MNIGARLAELRTIKKMSQGDVEKRTGLLRCYVSRVENGFTVPALETLEKFAKAFDIPLYQLFYESNNVPKFLVSEKQKKTLTAKQTKLLNQLSAILPHLNERMQSVILTTAKQLARNAK